jgi:creatinine amidohydrolase
VTHPRTSIDGMTDVFRWAELTRTRLTELLPDAVVAIATGATEQHGPHLATGTDALLAETVLTRAADVYGAAGRDAPRPLVLAPTLAYGASDHHLPFGGTLSLTPETLLAVLADLCRSIATGGGRRFLIVNGHGGNTGVCQAAAGAAAARFDLTVGYLDYWSLLGDDLAGLPADCVPGHAGAFETSLVSALRPELVTGAAERTDYPPNIPVPGLQVHSADVWAGWNGFTDSPGTGSAEVGRAMLDRLSNSLAERIAAFASGSGGPKYAPTHTREQA